METPEESGQELSQKQEAALLALLEAGTVRGAAAKCDASEATLYRYLQEPLFVVRYREARAGLIEAAIARVQSAADVAVSALLEIAENEAAAPTARIMAAKTILSFATRGGEWAPASGPAASHEHVCAGCLNRYPCRGKDCADLHIGPHCGACPKVRSDPGADAPE
jgi:hypothetical protein